MASIIPAPSARTARQRSPRIGLRRRLRASWRALLLKAGNALFDRDGERDFAARRKDAERLAALETKARSEAIEASVGAMTAADIQRVRGNRNQD